MGMMAPAPGAMGMMPMMPMGAPPPAAAPAGPPPIPSYAPTPATPAAPRTVMPGSLAPPPAPPAAPPPAPGLLQPQSLDLFGMPVAAPPPAPVAMPPAFAAPAAAAPPYSPPFAPPAAAAPAADPNDWGLDGLDLSGGPAAPPAAAPAPGGRNDWPAPEGVDPNVWSQLPAALETKIFNMTSICISHSCFTIQKAFAERRRSAPKNSRNDFDLTEIERFEVSLDRSFPARASACSATAMTFFLGPKPVA